MWSNRKSIESVVDETKKRTPSYCPNAKCPFHLRSGAAFTRHGSRKILRYPYTTFRFRCSHCHLVFSSSFFSFSFRDKLDDTYDMIHKLYCRGISKREIARLVHCDEHTVRLRLSKIARQALLVIAQSTAKIKITEPIAYDGLENFAFSQYSPNNINHAVGKESLFTYDFNFAPLNRKGRMSPRQCQRKRELEKKYGPYPKNAIESSTKQVFVRLLGKSEPTLHLHTDNHYAYRDALETIPNSKRIAHSITPAKVARNYRNRLFAVNHLDMLTRHHLAPFKRETIAFAKHSISMIESFVIFAAFKNFQRPRFLKPHITDPNAHRESPAMKIGVEKKILSFKELYRTRLTITQVKLSKDWEAFFRRIDPHSRESIQPYLGV